MNKQMNNSKLFKNFTKGLIFIFILSFLFGNFPIHVNPVNAATNLIKGGDFEGDINQYWGLWTDENSGRNYDFYRSYDAPFGYGSYSAAISAEGSSGDAFNTIFSGKISDNNFAVDSTKSYLLIFYAKASQNLNLITYLQRSDNYDPLTSFTARSIGTSWKKQIIHISPNATANSVLAFVLGDMPENSSLYLDGIQLVENNFSVATTEVRGKIKESNKFIKINGINNFGIEDVKIELPYFNNNTEKTEEKKFAPDRISSSGVYFTMPEQTFSGIAKIYICDLYIGMFDYTVIPVVNEIHPALARLDDPFIIYGSGINPIDENTYLVVDAINNDRESYKAWVKPETFDSKLSQASFHLPTGTVPGSLYIQTSYTDKEGNNKLSKSNVLRYKVKPLVYSTAWSERGYEQIGDKLRIQGKGFGKSPAVVFYNENNEKLETKTAKVLEVGEVEIIEVETTKKTNNFNISVISNGVESDFSNSLSYVAKPKITSISASHSRELSMKGEKISATKIGESIKIFGLGFNSNRENTYVEFEGNGGRIRVKVLEEDISSRGDSLKVIVPEGAVNGYVGLVINDADSNYLPLEIIPTVISTNPNPVIPGEELIIRANGIKNNLNLTKIHFKIDAHNTETVSPHSIMNSLHYSDIYVNVPLSFSANNSSFSLQYDFWQDDGKSALNILPHIVSASINMDNKILSIKGYGFSLSAKENIITYRYADKDQTVIDPKVRILGVYPSEEGQEIRVQILDDYHYGNVSVQVGENTSNQVNFGPASISRIARRVEYVKSLKKVMGVLYISGYNFGSGGGVQVGENWAEVHYRNDFFIIAVVEKENLYDNPVVVVRE